MSSEDMPEPAFLEELRLLRKELEEKLHGGREDKATVDIKEATKGGGGIH